MVVLSRQEGDPVRLKTFRAYSINEAIEAVREDLGPNAVILHTRTLTKRSGLFGLFRRTIAEVIASDAAESAPAPRPMGSAAASRAYAATQPNEETLDLDRVRTKRLAQAMNEREERRSEPPTVEAARPTPTAPTRYVLGANGDLRVESPPNVMSGDDELDAIQATVGRVIEADALPSVGSSTNGDGLAAAYASLIAQELARELADGVVDDLSESLSTEALAEPTVVREALLERVAALVPTAEATSTPEATDGRPWTMAFVGPTGVGKTTTLAKVASMLALTEGRKVGLVTADTYRVAAVDQLKTYADILSAPIAIANGPAEMAAAMRTLADCDVILVDTPGRSQNDVESIVALRSIIDAANPHEIHLVLSATSSERVLLRTAEAFADLRPDRIVLTKLDEAISFGMLLSVVRRIGRRLSWVTTGQEVPADLEVATGRRIAALVLGGPVKS